MTYNVHDSRPIYQFSYTHNINLKKKSSSPFSKRVNAARKDDFVRTGHRPKVSDIFLNLIHEKGEGLRSTNPAGPHLRCRRTEINNRNFRSENFSRQKLIVRNFLQLAPRRAAANFHFEIYFRAHACTTISRN